MIPQEQRRTHEERLAAVWLSTGLATLAAGPVVLKTTTSSPFLATIASSDITMSTAPFTSNEGLTKRTLHRWSWLLVEPSSSSISAAGQVRMLLASKVSYHSPGHCLVGRGGCSLAGANALFTREDKADKLSIARHPIRPCPRAEVGQRGHKLGLIEVAAIEGPDGGVARHQVDMREPFLCHQADLRWPSHVISIAHIPFEPLKGVAHARVHQCITN